ncbi:hypothetical protein ACLK1S_27405 [Escherichia coli]
MKISFRSCAISSPGIDGQRCITSRQAKWRDDAIMRSQSTSLIERRVRIALTGNRRWPEYLAGASADGSKRER